MCWLCCWCARVSCLCTLYCHCPALSLVYEVFPPFKRIFSLSGDPCPSVSLGVHCLTPSHCPCIACTLTYFTKKLGKERWKIHFYGIGNKCGAWLLFNSFFCVLRGTRRTLTGVRLVPRYWPGYQWYHGIRTTLGQHCTAECRVALRAVKSPEAIGTFFFGVVVERDSCHLAFRGGVVVLLSSHEKERETGDEFLSKASEREGPSPQVSRTEYFYSVTPMLTLQRWQQVSESSPDFLKLMAGRSQHMVSDTARCCKVEAWLVAACWRRFHHSAD